MKKQSVLDLYSLQKQVKKLQNQIEVLKNELKTEMMEGGLHEAHKYGFVLKIGSSMRSTLDTKAFKLDYPKLYDKYCYATEVNSFTLNKLDKEKINESTKEL
jgi:predicted phage-related endonuclease